MNYLLITNRYPKQGNLYRNAFVHRRIINYLEFSPNMNISVFVLDNKIKSKINYSFDSIDIVEGNREDLLEIINQIKPEKLLIHFLDRHMMSVIEQVHIKTIVWVHGVEALGWYRRLFNFDWREFPKYALINMRQMWNFRKFINHSNKNTSFIFVSEWMKDILECDTGTKIKRFDIIPNPIDNQLFPYLEKGQELRRKILMIRPFSSKKYANDIAIDAILQLSEESMFNELEFTIYGEGKYFDPLTEPLEKFKNVKLHRNFLNQQEMANVHKEHGIFLCPTRQDAQGVSMCEAMSSGLVPITSNNTAIPEYVVHEKTGILTGGAKEIASSIKHLYENPSEFAFLSKHASMSIQEKCRPELVTSKELELISDAKNV
ncbi:hypothetical protein ABE28_015870 [Peribacillus muralis]|uniref:Uncharacterized protein n=2 Tax=Peribacillus muralis TaxID=264697 RepID=A0A1B3XRH9_9BACI|nr:hypothetical protein ABE28_015870 [Peribacillus muralis]